MDDFESAPDTEEQKPPTKGKEAAPKTLGDLCSEEKINQKWYTDLPPDPKDFPSSPPNIVSELQEEAKRLLESETNGYNIKSSKNSQLNWMRTVMLKGTGRDKIAAFTLMVQENPLYNTYALKSLIGLVKPAKKENISAMDTLAELFISDLLPPSRKLLWFSQRPLAMLDELTSQNPLIRRRRLVLWYFESLLKQIFQEFLVALQTVATEAIQASKERAIKAMATLLASHPEQEAILLQHLVNKLGDPTNKTASRAVSGLYQVLHKHPNMKGIIMNEVEKLLFRPNVTHKARFYGICFLSRINFNASDSKHAAHAIKIYFSFFKLCVKTGDVDSKMLTALLSAVNKAYPYAKAAMSNLSEEMETLYKLVHIAPIQVSLHTLVLLYQVADHNSNVSDRFYAALYRKLLDPALAVTTHIPVFFNLTFQALKKDGSIPRVRIFIKRLLQICCFFPVPQACATLYMVSQVMHKQPALSANRFKFDIKEEVPETNDMNAFLDDDSEDEHYEDVIDEESECSKNAQSSNDRKSTASWVHSHKEKKTDSKKSYDPKNRNPLYAGGEFCAHAELCYLSKHFHPTVALYAKNIQNNVAITYSGDPLKDFTLIRFLDRFSFRNPKAIPKGKNKKSSVSGSKMLPVNAYLNEEEKNVPVDELYLFRYLQQKREKAEQYKSGDDDDDDDDDDNSSVRSDEFEDMIDDLLKKRGIKKDYDDEDDDLDFADEYSKVMSSKKSKKSVPEEEDMDDDMDEDDRDDDDDDDDLEGDDLADDDEDMPSDIDLDFDDDEEAIEFGSDSEDNISDEDSPLKSKKKKKLKTKELGDDDFADAEEFSELLEAAGSARQGTLGALANHDNAHAKQLDWEVDRDRRTKDSRGGKFKKEGRAFGGRNRGPKTPAYKARGNKFDGGKRGSFGPNPTGFKPRGNKFDGGKNGSFGPKSTGFKPRGKNFDGGKKGSFGPNPGAFKGRGKKFDGGKGGSLGPKKPSFKAKGRKRF